MDTSVLISTYERLKSEEGKVKRRPDLEPLFKRNDETSAPTVLDCLAWIEKEEVTALNVAHKARFEEDIDASVSSTDSLSLAERNDEGKFKSRTIIFRHNLLTLFESHGASKELPTPPPLSKRRTASSLLMAPNNPFFDDVTSNQSKNIGDFKVWRSDIVLNVIARRAKYGDPRIYANDSSFVASSSNLLSIAFNKKKDENRPQVDSAAYMFMRKHGMKRWFGKKIDKLLK